MTEKEEGEGGGYGCIGGLGGWGTGVGGGGGGWGRACNFTQAPTKRSEKPTGEITTDPQISRRVYETLQVLF